jgi:type I restriction enzyme S subunit
MTSHLPKVAGASRLSSPQDQKQDASATLSPAPKASSTAKGSPAPKGRNIPAQGNALGSRHPTNPSPEGAEQSCQIAKISDFARTTSGGTPSRANPEFYTGNIPWIKSGDLNDGNVSEATEFITEEALKSSSAKLFPAGTLMIALYGATIGKLGILTIDAATNQAVCGIFVPEEVETKYLFYFLLYHRPALIKLGAGGAQPNISQGIIRDIEIPIAPLPEQRRIVARIEELFSRLDAGVAALRHAKAQLKRYRQSVLAAAVTGSLPGLQPIPPEAWRPISDVIKTLDQGWSPKCESTSAESEDEWAVIKTTAIQAGFFLDYENKKLPSHLEPRGHLELKIGDLLLTRAGPRSRVGVACYVRKVRPKLMLCDKAYRVRLEPKKATPGFIELVLNSPRFVDALDDMKSGISDSGLNLTQKRFAELLIPLPTLAEQHQIVAEVEARATAIDHLEAELDRQITRSNRLRQSILHSAFEGHWSNMNHKF